MSTNPFTDILDRDSSTIERPRPVPTGLYHCRVVGLPRYDKSSKKLTPFVEFTLQPYAAMEDVDKDDLEAMGGFEGKTFSVTFYLTENSLFRLNDFLDNLGIPQGNMLTRVDQTPNCEVGVVIKHRLSDDGQTTYADVAKTISI